MGYLFHEDCYSDSDNYPRKRPDGWEDEDERWSPMDEEDFDCGEDDPRFDCDPGEYEPSNDPDDPRHDDPLDF